MGKNLNKKYGAVILLDALGASEYTDGEVRKFLATREIINSKIDDLAGEFTGKGKLHKPNIYTFGDTIIITIELKSKKYIRNHIMAVAVIMRRYLFHAFSEGILFRGAFSIGTYIEDTNSNTVMGEAVTDAASWYEKSSWMGLSSTPRTNSILEYYFIDHVSLINNYNVIHKYNVPMKSDKIFELYTISWPAALHEQDFLDENGINDAKEWFLNILMNLKVPIGTENKYENTKKYFSYIEEKIKNR